MDDLYDDLGIDKDATSSEIKKAYHKKAKETHPDNKDQGDANKFRKIKNAYVILYNPQTREKYDNGETVDIGDNSTLEHAVKHILSKFDMIIMKETEDMIRTMDLFGFIRSIVEKEIEDTERELNKARNVLKTLERKQKLIKSKLTAKGKFQIKMFHNILRDKIQATKNNIKIGERHLEILQLSLTVADGFVYDYDNPFAEFEADGMLPSGFIIEQLGNSNSHWK